MRRVLLMVAILACLTIGFGQAVPAHRTPSGRENESADQSGSARTSGSVIGGDRAVFRSGVPLSRPLSARGTLGGRGKHPAGLLGAASAGPHGAAVAPRPLSAPHIGSAACVESIHGGPVRPCKRPVCATAGPRTICRGRQVAYRHAGPEFWWGRYQREHRLRVAAISSLRAETRKAARTSQAHLNSGGSLYAIRLASALYHVPLNEMLAVARCETGGTYDANARNPSSSASGLFQWLDSSWAAQGVPGFSVFDPIPNALAAARAVVRDGGWGQWVCSP